MSTDILINASNYEVRLALVENGNLSEFHMQRPTEKGLMGNVYKGKIVRVLPGMQAAFVDIGLERTGFLYVDDVCFLPENLEIGFPAESIALTPKAQGIRIEDLLKEGQKVVVQVTKDPIGTKGARLTCHISLPCRNLVFMPQTDNIGISKKIDNEELRKQLKEQIENIRPEGEGFIVRTLAEHASREELEADMEFLLILWDEIIEKISSANAPELIHEDIDITLRSVRDFFTPNVDRLIIDDEKSYNNLRTFTKTFAPLLHDKITLYQDKKPIFDLYNIEGEIVKAIDKKVWLRSGGYIIIESTEALSVIDVNTGRFVGKSNLHETIFKTNIESAKEIANQLRLRNIGGIIIIDFIDMESAEHREERYVTRYSERLVVILLSLKLAPLL